MDRVLVTGAAGFIGSHLVERLLAERCDVLGLDNFNPFYDPALKRHNLASLQAHPGFRWLEADVRDDRALDRAFATFKPDVVVHLAAMAGVRPSLENPTLYADVNVTGTGRVLDAAVQHGTGRFVFASSSSVYGNNKKVPFAETDPVERPISPYAATKRAGELLCHTYYHVHGLPVTCLRFFTVYGPRQRPDLAINKFMKSIATGQPIPVYGDGTTSRDYTFIADIIEGILSAIRQARGYEIINLGSHRPVGLIELIRAIEKTVGRSATLDMQPMQPGDVKRTCADVSCAAEKLGYFPRTTLEEGLASQWAWMQKILERPA